MSLKQLVARRKKLQKSLIEIEKKIEELSPGFVAATSTLLSNRFKRHGNAKSWSLYQHGKLVQSGFESMSQIAAFLKCSYMTVYTYKKGDNKKGYLVVEDTE